MTIGHSCQGGGAAITNSPIIINIHIHAHKEPFTNKVLRGIYAIIGQRNIAIENASRISEDEFLGSAIREIEHR